MKPFAIGFLLATAITAALVTPPIIAQSTGDGYPWGDHPVTYGHTLSTAQCPPHVQPARVTIYFESIYPSEPLYTYIEVVCSEAEAKDYIAMVDAHGFDPDNTINDHIASGAIRRIDYLLLPPGGEDGK